MVGFKQQSNPKDPLANTVGNQKSPVLSVNVAQTNNQNIKNSVLKRNQQIKIWQLAFEKKSRFIMQICQLNTKVYLFKQVMQKQL